MPEADTKLRRARFFSGTAFSAGMVGLAMAAGAILGGSSLQSHLFWDDEANTAIYARNLIDTGRMTAWDGTNLVGYAYGGALGEDLGRELRVPPLPAYVAAAGMILFGQTTFGGRIMFVLAGVLSIGLLALWLRRHLGRRFPCWLPSIILALCPAYLLYIRNCRYYALGVLFTLMVLAFWAPSSSAALPRRGWAFHGRRLLRHAGAAAAVILLLFTHYLCTAAVLVALPVFLLHRRYRLAEQYVLLGIIYAAALVCGLWVLTTANPLAADYGAAGGSVLGAEVFQGRWTLFRTHLWWLLRDLGTHEFFPWCVVILLPVPWLPSQWLPGRVRSLRRLAVQGMVLLAVVLVYVLTAAALTPSDMARGPLAEMRYVVPLLAVGAAMGGLAIVMLWRIARPLGPLGLLLLVGTNLLHGGFLANRFDTTSAWWPPTLYRYVYELSHDYHTCDEAMVSFLRQLPAGTQVRVWLPHMVYPPMFYLPELHYCDQLSEKKEVRADLKRELPDYLFVERSRPEVMLVPAPFLRAALKDLEKRHGEGSYVVARTLSAYWNYTSKPEIPLHFFSAPESDWSRFPGMVVLLAKDSALRERAAMRPAADDAAEHYRLGMTLIWAEMFDDAIEQYLAALKRAGSYAETVIEQGNTFARREMTDAATAHYVAVGRFDPARRDEFLKLANLLTRQGTPELAVPYYRAVLWCDAENVPARVGLGVALGTLGEWGLAVRHLRRAVEIEPDSVSAYVYLAETLTRQWKVDEAVEAYQQALRLLPADDDSPSARRIRKELKRLQSLSTYRDER